jgi:LPS export ABC transporter protein LptC
LVWQVDFVLAAKESDKSKDADQPKEAEQKMLNFNFAGYEDGGQKKWDVSADTADIFSDVVNMQKVVGKAYGESDNFKLTADTGVYSKSAGNLHLQDNVIGTSDSGAELLTDSLNWDAKTGLITTEDKVNIKKENISSFGTGATANQNLKTVALNKDVTVNISREGETGASSTVITCDGPLDIDYNAQVAVFNKNVVATDEKGKLFADKMTVYFDTATKKIKKVVCSGDVKIDNGQNSAYGQEVTYNSDDKTASITGRPCLIFYSQKKGGEGAIDAPFGN